MKKAEDVIICTKVKTVCGPEERGKGKDRSYASFQSTEMDSGNASTMSLIMRRTASGLAYPSA